MAIQSTLTSILWLYEQAGRLVAEKANSVNQAGTFVKLWSASSYIYYWYCFCLNEGQDKIFEQEQRLFV
jgi:hypothetical protein